MLNKQYQKVPKNVLVFALRNLRANPKGYEGKNFLLLLQTDREVVEEALYTFEDGLFTKINQPLPKERKDYLNFVGRHSFMFSQPVDKFEEARAYSLPS